jgi:hypothetical protein
MAHWPLIPGGKSSRPGRPATGLAQLPLFYMNDYSRLGLRVDSAKAALRVLAENRYRIVRDDEGCHVDLESPSQVAAVVALLHSRGVACDIADVVDQVYQG